MKITPATFEGPRNPKHADYPQIAFYRNRVRFNKFASKLLGLPRSLAFDFDDMLLFLDDDGFPTTLCISMGDFVINSRPLSTKAADFFGMDKVIMRVSKTSAGFKMILDNKPVPVGEEIDNMLRVG